MGESDDDDNDLESDVRQQCEIELNKYKKSKTKIPKDGNYPDALAWWKKSAHLYPCLASLARKISLYSGHISTIRKNL